MSVVIMSDEVIKLLQFYNSSEENEEINVQDLLSHRTGLPNYMGLEFLGNDTREQLFQDLFYSKQVRD